MRCAYYVRCSTNQQDLSLHREKCKEWIQKNGHEEVKSYEDFAVSGKTLDRPALKHLLQDAENHVFDMVVFPDTSRASRTLKDTLDLIDTLTEFSIKVCFIAEHEIYDKDDPDSMFRLQLWAVFNERERKRIRQRMIEGLKMSKKKLGRKLLPSGITLEEQKKLHAEGMTIYKIAKLAKLKYNTVYARLKK